MHSILILKIVDKSLDIAKYLLNVDNKYKRRILKSTDKMMEYRKKTIETQREFSNCIANGDSEGAVKKHVELERYNTLYKYYAEKKHEYENSIK